MKPLGILDRYILKEWSKIFFTTSVGFPIFVILIHVTENLDQYLSAGIPPKDIALSYLFGFPDSLRMVLPAAVLFATLFSLGSLGRHHELTAAKASGRSFHRVFFPMLMAAVFATGIALVVSEAAPAGSRRQAELLGERERRTDSNRFNFVYRAEEGWVFIVRSLDEEEGLVRDVQFEREGTGPDYPTLLITSPRGLFNDSLSQWTMQRGQLRVLPGNLQETVMTFDSLWLSAFTERPEDLLAEPKRPEEMAYAELTRYIDALERSGGDARRFRVDKELKIAIPFTCLVIAIFSAPLAVASPRASGALGVGLGLGVTIIFLL
ncbi:MAG: LptF/LptG family permease, partial [Gemmatimonadota bacterium]|nr:LptF/LptG family permease [Gemmatimonadota bacterium]